MSHGQILPGETGKKPIFFWALISVAGGGVTIRHDGTLRTRRWRCVPAIDVENQRKKTGQWHWKNLSFNRKHIDSNGGFSTVTVSVWGGESICREYSGMIFPSNGGLIFPMELCEIDSDLPVDFLTCQKSHTHTHTSNNHLLFLLGFRRCIGSRVTRHVDLTQLMNLPGVLNVARLLLDNFRLPSPSFWIFWKVWMKRDVSEEILKSRRKVAGIC